MIAKIDVSTARNATSSSTVTPIGHPRSAGVAAACSAGGDPRHPARRLTLPAAAAADRDRRQSEVTTLTAAIVGSSGGDGGLGGGVEAGELERHESVQAVVVCDGGVAESVDQWSGDACLRLG